MNRQEKQDQVSEIQGLLDGAQLVILTQYAGLDVAGTVAFRGELRKAGTRYQVMKNTLAKIATKGGPFEGLHPFFKGPIGVVWTKEDIAGAAKAVVNFARDNPKLQVKAGLLVGGQVMNPQGLQALSTLPGKDQLRGMLLGAMSGVSRNFVSLLAAVPRSLVGVLEARRRQLAGE